MLLAGPGIFGLVSPLGAFGLYSGTCASPSARGTCLGCFDDIETLGSLSRGHPETLFGTNISHNLLILFHSCFVSPPSSRRQ